MATNAKSAAQKPADPTVQQNPKKKLFMIIGIVAAVAAAGGAGWFFSKGKGGEHHVEEVKAPVHKTPLFQPLDTFTVNLKSEGSDQFLQLGVTLKYFDPELDGKLKLNLPEIKSKTLQLLTTKTARELLTLEGKTKLAKDIVFLGNSVLGIVDPPAPAPVVHAPVVAAASAVEGEAHETHSADAAALAATVHAPPPVAPPPPAEKKGINDALFTSFIIQ